MDLTIDNIRHTVNELEETYPVENWVVSGIHIWPLVRVRLFLDLYYLSKKSAPSFAAINNPFAFINRASEELKSTFRYVAAKIVDRRHNATIAPADVLFLVPSVNRTLLDTGWYDKHAQPFVEAFVDLNMKSLVLETAVNGIYRLPRSNKSLFIQPAISFIAANAIIASKWGNTGDEELRGYPAFEIDIRARFKNLAVPSRRDVRFYVQFVTSLARYFKKLILKTKPSLAFLTNYDSLIGAAFIVACREYGIQTVDIQHGLTGDNHLAYGSFRKVAATGYEVLPSFFWCWGEYEVDTINKWNRNVANIHQPFLGGNLWANLWLDADNPMISNYDTQVRELFSGREGQVLILYSPSIPADLQPWIFETIKMSPPHYQWLLRLHPAGYIPNNLAVDTLRKNNVLSRVNLDKATSLPLVALLRHVDVNVTASSTTVFDAECFGVPSVLTDELQVSLFPQQLASGCAVAASTPAELLDAIKAQVKHKATLRKQTPAIIDNGAILRNFLLYAGIRK